MKKTILGLGSAAAIIAPIAGVVACGDEEETKKETLKEILTSKVLVLKTEDAKLADAALLAAIKKQLETVEYYGLKLQKAHMLTVNSDKSDGTTLAAIDVTTDETAKMVYVTVQVGDKEAAEDAKNIEIKVRKETPKAYHARVVDDLKKHLEMKYDTAEKALDLTKAVGSGVDSENAYTNAEFLTSLKNKLKAAPWTTPTIDGWIDNAEWVVKKYDTTAAAGTGVDNTVNISTGKKVEIEVSSGTGDDKAGPKMVSFYIKAA